MPSHLVEVVPNVSEGRDAGLIERLAAAITASGVASLLDVHSDADHNRSVFTVTGESANVVGPMLDLAGAAVEEIDLRLQRGVHPRMGALDVVPFVRLFDATFDGVVEVAHRFGALVWESHGVPVYFYGAADSRGRSLPEVRIPFEDLATAMVSRPPDIGDAAPHVSAGAIAVGAREVMVAFNVLLETADVAVARSIAGEIRERDGGLAGVRALGLYLESAGRAQVSMNLTEPARVGVGAAYGAVQSAAGRRGVAVRGGELVGLAPRIALGDCSEEVREACQLGPERELETKLES